MQNAKQQITITKLLMQREHQWITIWECEQKIDKILTKKYPYPKPPKLPSSTKKRIAKKTKKQITIRRLNQNENSYLITYIHKNQKQTSIQNDTQLIRTIINANIQQFQIITIQTAYYQSKNDIIPKEIIYQKIT